MLYIWGITHTSSRGGGSYREKDPISPATRTVCLQDDDDQRSPNVRLSCALSP